MIKTYFNRLLQNKLALGGLGILVFLALSAIFAPIISIQDPTAQNLIDRLQSPSLAHLLGTDDLGRDVFSRMVYGIRISLTVGFVAVGIAVIIGTILGLVSGYFGGWVDTIIMRFVDIMLCFPSFFLIFVLL